MFPVDPADVFSVKADRPFEKSFVYTQMSNLYRWDYEKLCCPDFAHTWLEGFEQVFGRIQCDKGDWRELNSDFKIGLARVISEDRFYNDVRRIDMIQ